jgi:hypothetical protein
MDVRDADGRKLGRVRRCHPWGFEVTAGTFGRREWVVRYDEVLDLGPGSVRVARSDEALFELAAGALPHAWPRIASPFGERPLPSAPADGDVEGELTESRRSEDEGRDAGRSACAPPLEAAAHGIG